MLPGMARCVNQGLKNEEFAMGVWWVIHHSTKFGFGLLKRPRVSGINTGPTRPAIIYSVAILDLVDQNRELFHNHFLNFKTTDYGTQQT